MIPTIHVTLLPVAGRLTYHQIGRMVVVTDYDHRLVAVVVRATRNEILISRVGERPPTMELRARWTGPLPKVGDYLMSQYRPRCAYQVARDPAANNVIPDGRDVEDMVHLDIVVDRVEIPLPAPLPDGVTVYPWQWDGRGKNTGKVNI
jgi:hypothetical protein